MTGDATSPADGEGRKAQLLKGLAELALLSVLRQEPRYGMDILDRLRDDAGLPIAEGTIYPLLHRLERGGSIRAEWRIDDKGARPRKYYALTEQGAEELAALHAEWRRISSALSAFLDR